MFDPLIRAMVWASAILFGLGIWHLGFIVQSFIVTHIGIGVVVAAGVYELAYRVSRRST